MFSAMASFSAAADRARLGGGHLALRRFDVGPRLVHGRTRILERLLRSLEARIALLRERLDLLLETRRGGGRGRLLLVGGDAGFFGGGEIGFEFRNLLPELVRFGPLALLPDETERVLSLVHRGLELGGGLRGPAHSFSLDSTSASAALASRARLGGVEGVGLARTELPLLRDPPVSKPPGLSRSPSTVTQLVRTSLSNATARAVAASLHTKALPNTYAITASTSASQVTRDSASLASP